MTSSLATFSSLTVNSNVVVISSELATDIEDNWTRVSTKFGSDDELEVTDDMDEEESFLPDVIDTDSSTDTFTDSSTDLDKVIFNFVVVVIKSLSYINLFRDKSISIQLIIDIVVDLYTRGYKKLYYWKLPNSIFRDKRSIKFLVFWIPEM